MVQGTEAGRMGRLETLFTYHPPTDIQRAQYGAIRVAALELARVIESNTPAGNDRDAAIRKVREAVMTANAAIATGGIG